MEQEIIKQIIEKEIKDNEIEKLKYSQNAQYQTWADGNIYALKKLLIELGMED